MAKTKGKVQELREMREAQVSEAPSDPEAYYAEQVRLSLAKSAEGFIQAGAWLVEARRELGKGRFKEWVEERLPISLPSVSRLMTIAEGLPPKISNWKVLPTAERTLYDLARLDEDEFKKVEPHLSPDLRRSDVKALVGRDGKGQPSEPADPRAALLEAAATKVRQAAGAVEDEHTSQIKGIATHLERLAKDLRG